jgi:hypothetical protein
MFLDASESEAIDALSFEAMLSPAGSSAALEIRKPLESFVKETRFGILDPVNPLTLVMVQPHCLRISPPGNGAERG